MQQEEAAALAADVAVRQGGEGVAAAGGAEHPSPAEVLEELRILPEQVHAACHGEGQLPHAGFLQSLVDGHKRGRASRVHRDRRSLQVVRVGHAGRQGTERRADRRVGGGPRVRHGRLPGAQEDADLRGVGLGGVRGFAGVVPHLRRQGQGQGMLRVHGSGLRAFHAGSLGRHQSSALVELGLEEGCLGALLGRGAKGGILVAHWTQP